MKTLKFIALTGALLPFIAAYAADSQPQTPHQLNQDNTGATAADETAAKVTVAKAKEQTDGTSVQIEGWLEQKRGEDLYSLRDDSGQIDAIIPAAVLNNAVVAPGNGVIVQGAIDKKQTPWRLRVSHFEKR